MNTTLLPLSRKMMQSSCTKILLVTKLAHHAGRTITFPFLHANSTIPFSNTSWSGCTSSKNAALQQSRKFQSSSSLSREKHSNNECVKVTFIDSMGVEKTVDAVIGRNLLEVAHDNNIELEGACGGGM